MKNKIEDLRNHLFATIEGLLDEENPLDIERAKAVAHVGSVIIESAKVEVKALEIIGAWRKHVHADRPGELEVSVLELTPPHSVEAEQGVLGGLMLDNAAWDIVGDHLQKEDFFRHEHRLIFTAISELAAKDAPFDVVTVSEAIEDLPEAGGLAYLGQLADNTPSVANIEAYAQIVRDRAHLRQLMSLGHHCTRTASNHQANPCEVQEEIEQKLFALGQDQHKSDFVDINKGLAKIVDTIDYRFNNNVTVTGVPTGLKDLDELSGGLQKSDLIIVGACPRWAKRRLPST